MSFFIRAIFLTATSISTVFGMGGSGADGGESLSGLYEDIRNVSSLIIINSPEANELRTNISTLIAKMSALQGANPQQLINPEHAKRVSSTIDGVVNMLLGTAAMSSVQTIASIKGSISTNPYMQIMFINQNNSASVWEVYMSPYVISAVVRVQASYASAILNYISQHMDRLPPDQIHSLNNSVKDLLNRLSTMT